MQMMNVELHTFITRMNHDLDIRFKNLNEEVTKAEVAKAKVTNAAVAEEAEVAPESSRNIRRT